MAVSLAQAFAALRLGDGTTEPVEPQLGIIQRALATAMAVCMRYAPDAPEVIRDEATVRVLGYLYESPPSGGRNMFANALEQTGAAALLDLWRDPRAEAITFDDAMVAETTGVTIDEVRTIATELVTDQVTQHNISDASHANLRSLITTLQTAVAGLSSEAGELGLVAVRITAGGEVQWSIDGGTAWHTAPGGPLAHNHEIPTVPEWVQNDGQIPDSQLGTGPRADNAVLVWSLSNGIYSRRWARFGGFFAGLGAPPSSLGVNGSDYVRYFADNVNRPELWEYSSNAWRQVFTWPDHRFHAGTAEPAGTLGADGEYYLRHDGTNALSFWLKNGGAWGKLCDFGTGSGGSGLTQSQVDARIAALVLSQARTGNTTVWGATKLGSSNAANRFLRSDGNNGVWTALPTWVYQPATRITGGKMGASWANNTVLATVSNIPTWVTHAQLVTQLRGALYAQLASDSDEITRDAQNHITVNAVPTPTQLAALFSANVSVDTDDPTKVEIDFPTGGTVTIPLLVPRTISGNPTRVGLWRYAEVRTTGSGARVLSTGGWATASGGWSISNANVLDVKAALDGYSDIYDPGASNPDWANVQNKPWVVGSHATTAVETGKILIDQDDGQLYMPAGNPQHGATWTLRAYGTADLGAGQSFEGYVDTYLDLPTTDLEDGDVYFVRSPEGFGPWVWVASTSTWSGVSERIYGSHAYPTESAVLREVAADNPEDDDFNGQHVAYGRPALAYTCTDYTAAAASTLHWARMEQALIEELHTIHNGLASRPVATAESGTDPITTIWRGTQAEYDALSSTDTDTLYVIPVAA